VYNKDLLYNIILFVNVILYYLVSVRKQTIAQGTDAVGPVKVSIKVPKKLIDVMGIRNGLRPEKCIKTDVIDADS